MTRRCGRWAALAVISALLVAGCTGPGAGKAGGAPAAAPTGTITLTFASADLRPVDTTFANLVNQDSGGHLRLRTVSYDSNSASVDQTIAADLKKGKLDVADVGSRAWESLGISAFRAYQDPFLITSRELLDAAVTGTVATGLLATLKPAGITGLAIAPDSIRYLYSTRPLTTPAQFNGAKIRINDSATTSEVLTALGATPVTGLASGPPAVQALRDGTLTAIESNPVNAMQNGYVRSRRTWWSTRRCSPRPSRSRSTPRSWPGCLPAMPAGCGRPPSRRPPPRRASAADRTMWGTLCGQGLKPLALTAAAAHRPAECRGPHLRQSRRRRADHPGDRPDRRPGHHRAPDGCLGHLPRRPGSLPHRPRSWTAPTASRLPRPRWSPPGTAPTAATPAPSGWPFRTDGTRSTIRCRSITIPTSPAVNFQKEWRPEDPVEVGTISITGNQATFVPEVNQQNGSAPATLHLRAVPRPAHLAPAVGSRMGHHSPVAAAELSHPGRYPASCLF